MSESDSSTNLMGCSLYTQQGGELRADHRREPTGRSDCVPSVSTQLFVSLHPSVDITVIALCSRSPHRVTMAPTDGTLPRSCPLIGGERVLSGEQLINTQPDCQPDINLWNESKGPTLGTGHSTNSLQDPGFRAPTVRRRPTPQASRPAP
ncbi:unnamed protein product [Boreogadus saida]